jgi:tRNA1Val (adenine37-N6)-methyltransferase
MEVTLDSIRDIRIYQSKTGYRFSVDALLLFDFVNLKSVCAIADLGSGSGIIGILIAKKYPEARVDLFELQEGLAGLSESNISLNSLDGRARVIRCDIRKFPSLHARPGAYDLVVSNPPFRKPKSGRINVEEERAIARHEITLGLPELAAAASGLLKLKGRFCVIYHPGRLAELIDVFKRCDLEPKRLRFVHSSGSSEAKMVLLEAVKGGRTGLKVEPPLFIYNDDGSHTGEMKEIYGQNQK